MNASIGHRIAGVLGAGAILGLTLAGGAGADAISASRHYSGHTSQGRAVTVTLRDRRISYKTSFSQRCNSHAGPVTGTMDIEHGFDLRKHSRGRFSLRVALGRTRPKGKESANEYFTAIYTASGRAGEQRASGSLSAVSTYHTLRGAVFATCQTGVLRWSAKARS